MEHGSSLLVFFIPTDVGNTATPTFICNITPVHPHGCGEHHIIQRRPIARPGSSPRMWGTQILLDPYLTLIRFIPTDVGNTDNSTRFGIELTVHPHGCGEHDWCKETSAGFGGSSPRMWGTLNYPAPPQHPSRFIPTDVGNTKFHSKRGYAVSVHPHGCGEHSVQRTWM